MRRFFGLLCVHKWNEVARYDKVGAITGKVFGIIVELHCERCGDVRWRRAS